jgi:hypothetical protein
VGEGQKGREGAIVRGLDALAASSVWVAFAAAALCTAAAEAMGLPPSRELAALAASGTFAIYNLDHLRDLERDRGTSPRRSAFVATHRRTLVGLTALAGVLAAALALRCGPSVVVLLAPVAGAGLLHRRLKRFGFWKPFYIAAAWTAVVVGLPALGGALGAQASGAGGWVAGLLFLTLLANAIASNLRDDEAVASRWGPAVPLRLARSGAGLAVVGGLLAPEAVRPLALVPAILLLALVFFRADERYGLVVVDGALGIGAVAALAFL